MVDLYSIDSEQSRRRKDHRARRVNMVMFEKVIENFSRVSSEQERDPSYEKRCRSRRNSSSDERIENKREKKENNASLNLFFFFVFDTRERKIYRRIKHLTMCRRLNQNIDQRTNKHTRKEGMSWLINDYCFLRQLECKTYCVKTKTYLTAVVI